MPPVVRSALLAVVMLASVSRAAPEAGGLAIDGRVGGLGAGPIAGAEVKLFAVGRARASTPIVRATTDTQGGFQLRAPSAGLWTIEVSAEAMTPVSSIVPLLEDAE